MTFRLRFTRTAERDLQRLYDFVIERENGDLAIAERALEAIQNAFEILAHSPFPAANQPLTIHSYASW